MGMKVANAATDATRGLEGCVDRAAWTGPFCTPVFRARSVADKSRVIPRAVGAARRSLVGDASARPGAGPGRRLGSSIAAYDA